MKAIDTNVLVRYLVRDDAVQVVIADKVIQSQCYLSLTVLLECVWLLSSRYALSRDAISAALDKVISLPMMTSVNDEFVRWALNRFRLGADFADMIHLVDGRFADQFTTFDRGVVSAAGTDSPLPIETLEA